MFARNDLSDAVYTVHAPIEGTIIQANLVTDIIGWEISVQTPYAARGKQVYYDLVHVDGLISGLRVGSRIGRGNPIAFISHPHGGHSDKFLDFGLRAGTHKQANATLDNWTGTEYLSFYDYVRDDLESLPAGSYSLLPRCEGNPIPEAKRTPRP